MWMGMMARMAPMRMRITRNKDYKPIMDQRITWMTDGLVGLTRDTVKSTNKMVRMAMVGMRMSSKMHRKLMMHQCRMLRTQDIVLESVKIRQYISDL
jgi:hypothetical protein